MLCCAYLGLSDTPQVLLWGDADDLCRLGALLTEHAISREGAILGGNESPDRVLLSFSDAPFGMRKVNDGLEWQIAPSDANHFVELIEAVTTNPTPSHHYLDCAVFTGIEVKVSLGEYSQAFRP